MKMLKSMLVRRAALTVVLAMALFAMTFAASAQTSIDGVITEIDGYLDAAIAVGIAVLLFVLGRKVVRRLI